MPKHLGQRSIVFFDFGTVDYLAEKFNCWNMMLVVSVWGTLANFISSLYFPAFYGGNNGLHMHLNWGIHGA